MGPCKDLSLTQRCFPTSFWTAKGKGLLRRTWQKQTRRGLGRRKTKQPRCQKIGVPGPVCIPYRYRHRDCGAGPATGWSRCGSAVPVSAIFCSWRLRCQTSRAAAASHERTKPEKLSRRGTSAATSANAGAGKRSRPVTAYGTGTERYRYRHHPHRYYHRHRYGGGVLRERESRSR